jgi:hypothetical protein
MEPLVIWENRRVGSKHFSEQCSVGAVFFSLIQTVDHVSGGTNDSGVYQEDIEDDIEICDLEDVTEIVEKQIEDSLAIQDAPDDEEEAAALEILDQIPDSGSYRKIFGFCFGLSRCNLVGRLEPEFDLSRSLSLTTLDGDTQTGELGAVDGELSIFLNPFKKKVKQIVLAISKIPAQKLPRTTARILISQAPARSVSLTPALKSMRIDDDSDDETLAEIPLENPFLDETDPSPSYASANLDASPLEDEEEGINDSVADCQLVTTSYLDQFDLAFNRKYNLIICLPCGSGLPLVALHKHLTITSCERMLWQEHMGIWKSTKVVLPHQPSVSRLPPKAAFPIF